MLTEKEDLQKQIQTLEENLLAAKTIQEKLEKSQKRLETAHSELDSLNEALKKTTAERASVSCILNEHSLQIS